jgi:hypothetical protein
VQLSTDAIHKLDKLISTGVIAGLKKLVIEPTRIRGIDEKQQVVLITENGVPDLGGKQIGINRIDVLVARMNLVKTAGDLVIDATDSTQNTTDIALLDIASGKTKAQFRCASVEAVKGVPKTITDTLVWEIRISSKILPTVGSAVTAMGSDTITIASKDGKTVSLECIDSGKDVFTTALEDPAIWIGAAAPGAAFCEKYPAKVLLALLKEASRTNDPVTLKIGEGGILSLKVGELDFSVLPVAV